MPSVMLRGIFLLNIICLWSVRYGSANSNNQKMDDLTSTMINLVGEDSNAAVKALKQEGIAQIVNFKDSLIPIKPNRAFTTDDTPSAGTPVVQMHGMGDFANDPHGMVPLANAISDYLGGAYVLNVQIGESDIADILNGFLMNLNDQVDYFANVVRGDSKLSNGFNAVGYSQGNLVIRGYIEKYNDPPVFNFISVHGPLAGVGSFPGCAIEKEVCKLFAEILGALAYKPNIQQHLTQANYFRDPLKISEYLAGDIFLTEVNNEVNTSSTSAALYKKNWESLHSLCLVKALGDTVVVPNDSEWFGFFKDGTFKEIWGFEDTPWYTGDTFGLKTLHQTGKVFFNTTEGNHLDFSTEYLLDLVGEHFV